VRHALELLGEAAAGAEAGATGGNSLWLTPELLMWSLAHVQSRSLGTAGSSGLGESFEQERDWDCGWMSVGSG